MRFEDVQPPLCQEVLDGVRSLGFEKMTPVQTATIPLFLSNKDVLVDACTGSGKTLSFVIPMVEILKRRLNDCKKNPSAVKIMGLVISPTRELAKQIYEAAFFFMKRVIPNVHATLFVGGTSVEEDLMTLSGNKGKFCLVVGTPGRIDDIFSRTIGSTMDSRDFEVLILDEADTLLDMGFEQSINQILYKLPKQRRTGLFSATQTREVKSLARAGLRNPASVSVQSTGTLQKTPLTLTNFYVNVTPDNKISSLFTFLQQKLNEKVIVFFSTCASVDYFGLVFDQMLKKSNKTIAHSLVSLHGKMVQKKRTANYESYAALKNGFLFCTDIVARGIDLPDVDWIVQYDPPNDPNFFVHRVGRTARAGRQGYALTFLSPTEDTYINFLKIRNVPMEEMNLKVDENVLPGVRKMAMEDRDVLEKGTKAFIAFLRAYKEHQCQFIFRFKDLDLGAVARGFALLKLPKINEFRKSADQIDFVPADVNTSDIAFKDKNREKQRQKQLTELRAKLEEESLIKKNKKRKLDSEGNKKAPRRREKKKGKQQQIQEEWDELAKEELLFKKLKRGKLSQTEYEKAVANIEYNGVDTDMDDSDQEPKKKLSKMEQRFVKRPERTKKTAQQKNDLKKREQRIRRRKKIKAKMK